MASFCWKLGHAYCGFGDVEDTKPGLIEWEDDKLAAEALEHRMNSSKIEEMESSIAENVRQRQERQRLHRLTVFAKRVVATECPRTTPKTKEEMAFLGRVLAEDRNFIFCDFSEKERGFMLDVLRKDDSYQQGDVIYSRGDVGQHFYIIESGSVDITTGYATGTPKRTRLGKGDSFGEVALIYDVPRSTSARATKNCVLWKMHQHCFRAKIAHHAMNKEEEMMGLLRRVSLFQNIEDSALRKFANSMELVRFHADQRIVNKGDEGRVFYVIDHGEVKIHGIGAGDSQSVDLVKKAGEWFGERALLTGERRYAHATALTAGAAWAVDRDTFETSFGPLQDTIHHQMKKGFLKVIPIFAESDVNPSEMDQLTEKMRELCFKSGHHFDEVGKPRGQELIIIGHGRITVYDDSGKEGNKVFTLKTGDYYGDKHIRDHPAKESSLNVVCEENTTVWSLSRQDLQSVIGNLNRLGQSVSFKVKRRVSTLYRHIPLKDLEKEKVLGHGGFGKVFLVKHKNSGVYYALKQLNKRRIIEKKQATNVLREREIMRILDHPFILGEVSSFQDETNCYILMQLIQGGELYNQIVNTRGDGLPIQDAKFYGACIQCALAHFHSRLIAYRDLKPENVMIDKDGYCVLVDLGFAKVVTTKTFTLCGTPEYLAPEILMSQGHDKAADLWSFGVLIFEMVTGRSAFYRPGRTQVQMFKQIVKVKYELPPQVDPVSADLIQKLIVRNPALRLGNLSNGCRDICDHPWFESIEWKQLRNKKSVPPMIPVIKEGDAVMESHYDASSGAYNKISFGMPLTKDEQTIFRSF